MDVEVLERLEDKLKDAMIRRDNRMSLEEGILEHITSVQSFFFHFLAPSGAQGVMSGRTKCSKALNLHLSLSGLCLRSISCLSQVS